MCYVQFSVLSSASLDYRHLTLLAGWQEDQDMGPYGGAISSSIALSQTPAYGVPVYAPAFCGTQYAYQLHWWLFINIHKMLCPPSDPSQY